MPDTQFSPLGTVTAPADWRLPPSLELVLKAAQATYDGTGAGGSFQPALQIVSDSGHSVGIYTCDTTIAAGSSCEVSFFPFSPSSAGGGSDPHAVHYDVLGETGGFIDSTTTTGGITFEDHSGSGLQIESEDPGGVTGGLIGITTANGEVFIGSNTTVVRLHPSGGDFEIQDSGSNEILAVTEDRYVTLRLGNATVLDIRGPGSRKIMQVIDGGGGVPEYHILTGGAWVADL